MSIYLGDKKVSLGGTKKIIVSDEINPKDKYVNSGLIGYFSLENNINDYFGNFPVTNMKGCCSFIEDDIARIHVRHHGGIGFNASILCGVTKFSYSIWMRGEKFYPDGNLACFGVDEAWRAISMYLFASNGILKVERARGNLPIDNDTDLLDNLWHNLAFVYDNGILKYYLDGYLKNSISINLNIGQNNYAYGGIGAWLGGEGYYLGNGCKLSKLLIYNEALNSEQILENYNADKDLYTIPKESVKNYELIEYVQSANRVNTLFLNTPNKSNIEIEIDFQYTSADNDASLFGVYVDRNNYFYCTWYQNKWYLGLNNQEFNEETNTYPCTTRQIIKFNCIGEDGTHQVVQQVGENTKILCSKETVPDGLFNISLFARTGSGIAINSSANIKIFDIKIKDNLTNNLLKHFIPAKYNSEYGLLEELSNVFYKNVYNQYAKLIGG